MSVWEKPFPFYPILKGTSSCSFFAGVCFSTLSSKIGTMKRDRLLRAFRLSSLTFLVNSFLRAMLILPLFVSLPMSEPSNELDVKQPLYRKSMRFPVLYYSESYA